MNKNRLMKTTVTDSGEITDHGDYSEVMNLSNLDVIESDKDEQTVNLEKGKFYYQGNLEKAELPWSFDISYILDGDDVSEEELAGAEGDLVINIKTKRNPGVVDESFFNAYMLQVSLNLDATLCEDIVVDGANISDAGSDEKITFMVNPGSEASLKVSASVKDFEMDDISIAAVSTANRPISFVSDDNNNHIGTTNFIIYLKV
ncbi:MAG: hypothetical protein ACERKZ_19675 [Lachnotalea sp.]